MFGNFFLVFLFKLFNIFNNNFYMVILMNSPKDSENLIIPNILF
jgi:hypothetical protein